MDNAPDVGRLAAGLAPPATYMGAKLAGMTPDQWITVLTLVWLGLGILGMLFPSWRQVLGSAAAALLDLIVPTWRRFLPKRWRDG